MPPKGRAVIAQGGHGMGSQSHHVHLSGNPSGGHSYGQTNRDDTTLRNFYQVGATLRSINSRQVMHSTLPHEPHVDYYDMTQTDFNSSLSFTTHLSSIPASLYQSHQPSQLSLLYANIPNGIDSLYTGAGSQPPPYDDYINNQYNNNNINHDSSLSYTGGGSGTMLDHLLLGRSNLPVNPPMSGLVEFDQFGFEVKNNNDNGNNNNNNIAANIDQEIQNFMNGVTTTNTTNTTSPTANIDNNNNNNNSDINSNETTALTSKTNTSNNNTTLLPNSTTPTGDNNLPLQPYSIRCLLQESYKNKSKMSILTPKIAPVIIDLPLIDTKSLRFSLDKHNTAYEEGVMVFIEKLIVNMIQQYLHLYIFSAQCKLNLSKTLLPSVDRNVALIRRHYKEQLQRYSSSQSSSLSAQKQPQQQQQQSTGQLSIEQQIQLLSAPTTITTTNTNTAAATGTATTSSSSPPLQPLLSKSFASLQKSILPGDAKRRMYFTLMKHKEEHHNHTNPNNAINLNPLGQSTMSNEIIDPIVRLAQETRAVDEVELGNDAYTFETLNGTIFPLTVDSVVIIDPHTVIEQILQ